MKTTLSRTEDYRSTSTDVNEGLDSNQIVRRNHELMVVIDTLSAIFSSTLCLDVLRKSIEYRLPSVTLLINRVGGFGIK